MTLIPFFATPDDTGELLRKFEADAPLKFVEMGQLNHPNRPIYLTSFGIPELGIATHETASMSQAFLVSNRDTKNHMTIETFGGKTKVWNLFSAQNEEAVVLSLGGLWTDGSLLPGSLDAVHSNNTTKRLIKRFREAIKVAKFEKVDKYWVGPVAMKMLESGKRLATTAIQSPAEWDLKLP